MPVSRGTRYKLELDTEKQGQCRCNNARLTESRSTGSVELLMMPKELLLSGLECSKAWLVFRYEISDLLLPVC